jgi:hypothetical protein
MIILVNSILKVSLEKVLINKMINLKNKSKVNIKRKKLIMANFNI